MKIDRQRVKEQFASYTRDYDPEDTKIALKIAHTYRVADHCEQIARSIGLSDDEVEFAWLSGMLHDIGRFEQAIFDNRIGVYDAYTDIGAKEGWCRFMISGLYTGGDGPPGMEIWTIPATEWAKFYCEGPLNVVSETIKKYIWYEWLPGNMEYDLGGDYFITKYCRSKESTAIDYFCEMWIPVKN